MIELSTRNGLVRNRWLVFTSAGDRADLHRWLRGRRGFDLWVTYYGDAPGTHQPVADLYNARKGSKFQNLHYAYGRWPEILRQYDAVMVMDDDIVITGAKIAKLFGLLERYQLWVLQPAFSPWGKISWQITQAHRGNRLRYTNFVEVTCPVFRADKLAEFMKVYDPALVGLGCDWWFLHVLGPDLKGRIAVVDEVVCTNPFDVWKGGKREIDRLQTFALREATWERIKQAHGVHTQEQGTTEFGSIPKGVALRLLGRATTLTETAVRATIRTAWKAVSTLTRDGGAGVGL